MNPAPETPVLAAHAIHKTYRLGRERVEVLRGASLSVRAGECLAILGASGSGKSTLLHILGGLDVPDRAKDSSLIYRGRQLLGLGSGEINRYRAQKVGFVFQFYHLLPELSVLDNVAIAGMIAGGARAAPAASRKAAGDVLERVGLAHRLRHRPSQLSGGERQRAAIARALVNQPDVLLADEPTGNLDEKTGNAILDLLMDLRTRGGMTMVLVTHDPKAAARADRTISISDGLCQPSEEAN